MTKAPRHKSGVVIRLLAFGWLVFVLAFALGVYTQSQKVWPYTLIAQLEDFLAGHAEEDTSLVEKLRNDLDISPDRHIVEPEERYPIPEHYRSMAGLPLQPRRIEPAWFLSSDAPRGFRVLYGTFDFHESLHGVVMLDPDGRVANVWHVSQQDSEWAARGDGNVFPHGLEIARDGSIVVTFDQGSSLNRYGYCGDIVWRARGSYHHSVEFDGPDVVWSWGAPGALSGTGLYLVKLDFQTGRVIDSFTLAEVLRHNSNIDIFGISQRDSPQGSSWNHDPWHPNDLEPLPGDFEAAYPDFRAGDLLVSLRAVNLVLVMDPHDLSVKWWRQGLTRRQHDPDWNAEGTITIFDNNMHRGRSRIVEIDPATFRHKVVLEGEPYRFYTWHHGKHDRTPGGGFLVTSSEQGRVFEVDGDGDLVFEFVNRFQDDGRVLTMSEALFLPPDYFHGLPLCDG